MKLLVAAALVLLLQPADAYCPNGCNAQGTCGANDKCTCYLRNDDSIANNIEAMYTGADCSLRTCPRGLAFVDVPTANNVAHAPSECSNRGLCDYSTGLCQCFPGYEGKACERTACPNQCSRRGICLTLKTIISYGPSPPTYAAWDADKQLGCICDLGYRGPDCSIKECPSGADVLLGHGANEGRDCGGRGKCDTQTGTCVCFPGYYGTYCAYQSTVH
ncbi:hypothetical protein H257_14065 [Aphanomyces astaci]|uniref:EGF-like domain-containing protein n=1 Tax=Aphanomyces astaci TaxID=112090 RepID=W4FSA0_APHAT|nr:hypothetical protein H257_14065 [Aphanomyces astaci]ETV70385.1 hypothetical protein H257_14065 [Aphanomyces astaci]KAF0707654.1 hypothetical protein AaE_013510 [Aphanomyces astaci]RHX98511.1 hypothetical protein DYB25_011655 [Aphanomyces astaci]RHY05135.1 hypothetical protein DYB36_006724 [Aphanomyces astaci]RHY41835.1 hypothetical protein DYB38_004265 [Aphanomyces astaci]|eukprot:XP_009840097.1 hypothetical protein H257_14065 [Aphanomyces astaci]